MRFFARRPRRARAQTKVSASQNDVATRIGIVIARLTSCEAGRLLAQRGNTILE
jgi:hypothetical protein